MPGGYTRGAVFMRRELAGAGSPLSPVVRYSLLDQGNRCASLPVESSRCGKPTTRALKIYDGVVIYQ